MTEYIFAAKNHYSLPQVGEITHSNLDPIEEVLVEELVNWKFPKGFEILLHAVHGRSIIFQSPTRFITDPEAAQTGNYNGLQLIGAGGDEIGFVPRFRSKTEAIKVNPVDPTNHAETLEAILQLRKIDETGHLRLWHRPYAPLHGMDIGEATKRKLYTELLNKQVEPFHESGTPTLFVFPKLVAEGIFPTKVDPEGQPLQFQVYRVPLVDRFPTQYTSTTTQHGLEIAPFVLSRFSNLAGRLFRNLHVSNLAYMDGHIGNMSLILPKGSKKQAIFATDLGSIFEIKDNPFAKRYHGLDVFTFLMSTREYLENYFRWIGKNTKLSQDELIILADRSIYSTSLDFLEGYYKPELKALSATLPTNELTKLITFQAEKLIRGYFKYDQNPQGFLEFFEEFDESSNL